MQLRHRPVGRSFSVSDLRAKWPPLIFYKRLYLNQPNGSPNWHWAQKNNTQKDEFSTWVVSAVLPNHNACYISFLWELILEKTRGRSIPCLHYIRSCLMWKIFAPKLEVKSTACDIFTSTKGDSGALSATSQILRWDRTGSAYTSPSFSLCCLYI